MTRSPHHLKEQVREAVSELPIHAARLAVMGVGRALLLTDRVRKDYREAREAGLGPVLGRLRDDAENLTGKVIDRVTGSARPTGPRDAEPEIAVGKPEPSPRLRAAEPVPPPRVGPDAERPGTKAAQPKTAQSKTKPAQPEPRAVGSEAGTARRDAKAAAALPVPGYDQASIASVRARLRVLDAGQVAALRDYERTHAARADFLRMFENRINKLKSGG